MIKNEVRIKENISLTDRIQAIERIVASYFTENDEGEVQYTPYFLKLSQILSIVFHFIEGVEFDDSEDIYDIAMNDHEIRSLIDKFFVLDSEPETPTEEQKLFGEVMATAMDIVEYRKKENLARIQNDSSTALTYKLLDLAEKENQKLQQEIETTKKLEEWLDTQAEINSLIPEDKRQEFYKNFNLDSLMTMAIEKMEDSELHRKNTEILELSRQNRDQENKIIELKTAYEQEKQKDSVKNVLSDRQ